MSTASNPARPAMLAPNPDGVPAYLAGLPRWLLWRIEQRVNHKTGEISETKPPISYHTSKHCDGTNPRSWTDFTNVRNALGKSRAWDGFGIALGEVAERDEILIGLDADNCLNPETGAAASWAMPFLTTLASYTEYSPGGAGLKCVVRVRRSDFPLLCKVLDIREGDRDQARTRAFGERSNGSQHVPGVQLFLSRRYFTLTGRHWHASPEEVTDLPPGQFALLGVLFGPRSQATTSEPGRRADDDVIEPDEAAIRDRLAAAFVRNPRLRERWEGGTAGLRDTSRSGRDMSVAALLIVEGFSKGEVRAALRGFPHGKLVEEEDAGRGDRYVDQIWQHSGASPRSDPLDDPAYIEALEADAAEQASRAPRKGRGALQPPTAWAEPVDCFVDLGGSAAVVTEDEAPPALWPFISDSAERTGFATSSFTLAAIVGCSSVIDEAWRIQPKRHDWEWTETSILWGSIVGPPACGKTPVIRACTRPIEALERAAREQWAKGHDAWKAAHDGWKEAKKDKDSDPGEEPKRPRCERHLVESFTMEALQEVLRDDEQARFSCPAGKVLCRQYELAEMIANLDRYHGTGRSGGDQGALLRLADGGPYSVDRVQRGSFFSPSWAACVLGGVQPEPIQAIASRAADDGLLQRFCYDVPQPGLAKGHDRAPARAAGDRYRALFPALAALHPARTQEGHTEAVVLHHDAHEYREQLDDVTRLMALMPDMSPRLRSALGKWPGLFARLCLVFHLIGVADARARGEGVPPLAVVSAAVAARVARYMRRVLLPHLLRADALMFATAQSGHARWIAGHILAHGLDRIAARDLRGHRLLGPPEGRDTLNSVMASLVAIGWLDPEASRNALVPVSAWRVNPLVHESFAARAAQERAERQQRREEVLQKLRALGEGA